MSINSLIKKYNVHPKKSLGQNFLIAVPTMEKIVNVLNPTSNDKVLEIGAGLGVMTKLLADRAKFVAAIEADKNMIHVLENEWGSIPNLHIIHGDILDTNLEKLLGTSDKLSQPMHRCGGKWLFAGNIPYNITSPLLFHLRKFRKNLKHGLLTMQKEVAERLIAGPGTKDYGILSIAMQAVADVKKCFDISASSFFPAPNVESSVVRISFEEAPSYNISNLEFFTTVVRAAFSTRRKKLKNALSQSTMLAMPADKIAAAICKVGIKDNSRAEELDIETFAKLADALR